ncbi:hypothetical protein WK23_17080 [Burkholderia vietnamiensis]|nr:hypothetical protein WK23_17080 [Burkholderia vietnamiensis]
MPYFKARQYSPHFIIGVDIAYFTSFFVFYAVVVFKVLQYQLFVRRKPLVTNRDKYRVCLIFDSWRFQAQLSHCVKCCVQSFADILVGRVGEFIQEPHQIAVSCETLV